MNKELEKQLAVVFEQDYPGYEFFVEHVINRIFTEDDAYEALPVPEDYLTDENRQKANESGILRIDKVGTIETEEPIEVFDVTLSNRKELQYNRVGIQQFIRSSLFPFTNAFMLFHNETPKDKDWRFSFAYKESTIKGMTSAKRYTYLFGKNHRARTASERFAKLADEEKDTQNLLNAFSVETLSKDFFNEYKNQYKGFCNFLFTHKSDSEYFGREFAQWEDKYIRDYVKKMMGRITFIYFLQRKGWMNGDMEYMQNAFMRSSHQDDYLDVFLEPLFFGVLNTKPEERKDLFEQEGWDLSLLNEWKDVPYLNGGLFERDKQDEPKSKFPAEMFKELFEFYSRYNFTIDENDPDDAEVGVDPEMLGHIFENLLEDNKDKGAFYTPKEIVQYMSQESVAQYLKSHVQSDLHEAIDVLVKHREVVSILQKKENAKLVYNTLAKVKVCDPAIGSGAFPMGVLNVLFDSRLRLYPYTGNKKDFSWAKTKREIIQNNIYGVDIEKGAVDIARLRFWLALVVDESEPQPLPNLDYKIMCGDSLLHRFALDAPFKSILRDYNQKNGTQYTLDDYRQWVYDYTDISDHTQKDTFRQKIEDIKHAVKTELSDKEKGKIAKVRGTIANLQMEDMFGGKKKENEKKIKALQKELESLEQQRKEIESNKIYEQAFEWRFEFPALLDEEGNFTGFDIVIGNPPYIQLEIDKGKLAKLYESCGYETFDKKANIYCLFFESGRELLKEGGFLCFITLNKWMRADYGQKLRTFLTSKTNPKNIIDFGGIQVFESANVDTNILLFEKNRNNYQLYFSELKLKDATKNFSIEKFVKGNRIMCKFERDDSWVIMDDFHKNIMNKIRTKGKPLKDWKIRINYGIKTGFNPAFIISTQEREKILSLCKDYDEKQRTERLIRPILQGRDIKKYGYKWSKWLIGTFPSKKYDIDDFPAVKQFLMSFTKERLEQTGKSYVIDGNEIKARKKTHGKWFETQDSISYWQDFDSPKVMYPNMTKYLPFYYDEQGFFSNDKSFIITGEHLSYLVAFFNSSLFKYCFIDVFPPLGEDRRELRKTYFQRIPVIEVDDDTDEKFRELVLDIQADYQDEKAMAIDQLIYDIYGLTEDERDVIGYIDFHNNNPETERNEVLIVNPETPITREEYEDLQEI